MKTKLLLGIFLASTMLLWSSCSNPCGATKEEFLEKYNTLVNRARTSNMDIGDEGWEDYDRDFRQMVQECYDVHEPELNILEKTEFWWDAAMYMKARYGDKLFERGGDLWDMIQEQLNILGESNILETIGDQYNKITNTVGGIWNSIFGGDEEEATE